MKSVSATQMTWLDVEFLGVSIFQSAFGQTSCWKRLILQRKLIYKQKEAELREKYDEEMKTYKEGETYKAKHQGDSFRKTVAKIDFKLLLLPDLWEAEW